MKEINFNDNEGPHQIYEIYIYFGVGKMLNLTLNIFEISLGTPIEASLKLFAITELAIGWDNFKEHH